MITKIQQKASGAFRYPILLLSLLFIIFLGCQNDAVQKPITEAEKKELEERIAAFNTAFEECNVEQLTSMITDNYVHTNGSSKSIGKEAWVNYLNNRKKEMDSGNLIVTHYEMQESELVFYDDMAILTAKIVATTIRSGTERENEYRITNVWVIENDSWKRAGFHDQRIK